MTCHPWIGLQQPCPCLHSTLALTTELALVRWWEPLEASQGLPLPTSSHSLSPTTTFSDIDDTASGPLSHEEFSDSRDGTTVPLLRTESIRLKDLDRTLLAEVKDVLIPHERVVIHSDQVIGKGVGDGIGKWGGAEERS